MKFKGSQYADTRANSWMKEKSLTTSGQVLPLQACPLPLPARAATLLKLVSVIPLVCI